jgi:hypothetical protein
VYLLFSLFFFLFLFVFGGIYLYAGVSVVVASVIFVLWPRMKKREPPMRQLCLVAALGAIVMAVSGPVWMALRTSSGIDSDSDCSEIVRECIFITWLFFPIHYLWMNGLVDEFIRALRRRRRRTLKGYQD